MANRVRMDVGMRRERRFLQGKVGESGSNERLEVGYCVRFLSSLLVCFVVTAGKQRRGNARGKKFE